MKFDADVIKMNWDEFIKPETRPKREKEKKPSISLYLALLVIVILFVAVYYLLYSSGTITTDRSRFEAAVPTPGTEAEVRQVANDLGKSLDETSNIIDDLSTSLGG